MTIENFLYPVAYDALRTQIQIAIDDLEIIRDRYPDQFSHDHKSILTRLARAMEQAEYMLKGPPHVVDMLHGVIE